MKYIAFPPEPQWHVPLIQNNRVRMSYKLSKSEAGHKDLTEMFPKKEKRYKWVVLTHFWDKKESNVRYRASECIVE